MDRNVIVMRFEDDNQACQALAALKDASAAGLLQLLQAAVVQRDMQGRLQVKQGAAVAQDSRTAVYEQVLQSMPAGATSLVAIAREFAQDVVNSLAREWGGVVERRPLSALQATGGVESGMDQPERGSGYDRIA